jgi:hypothetical protein
MALHGLGAAPLLLDPGCWVWAFFLGIRDRSGGSPKATFVNGLRQSHGPWRKEREREGARNEMATMATHHVRMYMYMRSGLNR